MSALTLLSGFVGVQHTRVLVHRVSGERLTVPALVQLRAAQGFLDHWLLQPSRLPDSNETGQPLHDSRREDSFILQSLPFMACHFHFTLFVLLFIFWFFFSGLITVKECSCCCFVLFSAIIAYSLFLSQHSCLTLVNSFPLVVSFPLILPH